MIEQFFELLKVAFCFLFGSTEDNTTTEEAVREREEEDNTLEDQHQDLEDEADELEQKRDELKKEYDELMKDNGETPDEHLTKEELKQWLQNYSSDQS